MKPWQLGDGDNTVATEQLRMEFIFDSINRQLAAIGVTDQTTFDVFANYIGYSTGGTPSYQDMQVAWTPSGLKLGEMLTFTTGGSSPSLTDVQHLVFSQAIMLGVEILQADDLIEISAPNAVTCSHIAISQAATLTSVSFPSITSSSGSIGISLGFLDALTAVDFTSLNSVGGTGGLAIYNSALLPSLAFPSLTNVDGTFDIDTNTALTSISAPLLVTCGTGMAWNANPLLTTIDISSYLPTNGMDQDFSGNALNVASVDAVLARCVSNPSYVSGAVKVNGGTNAAPSSIGPGSDYNTLIGRGVTVLKN